ncbi:hypothetical protein GIB67_006397 [Kingdonia uniflora]|uniref:AAA+ ATPase domain-containing protein n=1 Tax=Kingdonia uniflora TaxID=39325 RepID=A0A7J7P0S2_9MAGN|nr:hypothetical protein GIB67_006397 [Kingdonia uniflora]
MTTTLQASLLTRPSCSHHYKLSFSSNPHRCNPHLPFSSSSFKQSQKPRLHRHNNNILIPFSILPESTNSSSESTSLDQNTNLGEKRLDFEQEFSGGSSKDEVGVSGLDPEGDIAREPDNVAAEKERELPVVVFLMGALALAKRGFTKLPFSSEWLNWWPFWLQEKRLERLIEDADLDPKDAAKQSALLTELNKHSPQSVIRRFEQRDHAVDSRGVAEYLRALVSTNTISEYLPDEKSGKSSTLPALLQELKQRASGNMDEILLSPGISEKQPLHVIMVDPKASNRSARFAQELFSTIFFTVVISVMWVIGAAGLQKYVAGLGGIGASGVGSSSSLTPKDLNKEVTPDKSVEESTAMFMESTKELTASDKLLMKQIEAMLVAVMAISMRVSLSDGGGDDVEDSGDIEGFVELQIIWRATAAPERSRGGLLSPRLRLDGPRAPNERLSPITTTTGGHQSSLGLFLPATATIQGVSATRVVVPQVTRRDGGMGFSGNDRNGQRYFINASGDCMNVEHNLGGQMSARAPPYVPPRPHKRPTPPQGPRYSGQSNPQRQWTSGNEFAGDHRQWDDKGDSGQVRFHDRRGRGRSSVPNKYITHSRTDNNQSNLESEVNSGVKINVPDFDGKSDADSFIDWLNRVDKMFAFKKCTGQRANVKTFKDVKGCDDAKQELEEVVEYLRNPSKFTRLGGKLPKGILLTGSPGTGKTLLAKAIAGEAGVPFFYRAGSEFEEMFVGVGARRVRALFQAAKKKAPCIIFIDEIDAIGSTRKQWEGHTKKTLHQLLVEMDGFEQNEGIILMAATNLPDILDPALTRPGRFDRHIVVTNPDVRGRQEILELYLQDKPLADEVDINAIARGTPGFNGADLANLVNIAAIKAAVEGADKLNSKQLEFAKDRIVMGTERKTMFISEESKKLTAYHESGHAIVALNTNGAHPIHKATIMPRGSALGMVTQLPSNDETSISKKQLLARLDVCMGGRVAEELIFGQEHVTTGASSDLQTATELAKYMVSTCGMSDVIGPVFIKERPGTEMQSRIDAEVVKLLREAYERVRALLKKHEKALHALANALLEYETLNSDDIKRTLLPFREGPLSEQQQQQQQQEQQQEELALA